MSFYPYRPIYSPSSLIWDTDDLVNNYLLPKGNVNAHLPLLQYESFPRANTEEMTWTCLPSGHYALPAVSLLQEPLPSVNVAHLLPTYMCLCTGLRCVCSSSQRSAVSTTPSGLCLRAVLAASQRVWRPEGAGLPLIVINVICTNTNCVNTREHGPL